MRNKRERCDRQIFHRITWKDERKKCVHGGKERFKEQYSANIDLRIRNLDISQEYVL